MTSPDTRRREPGIDVARALALLLSVQGHAYDGWVAPAFKGGLAYAVTRELGNTPAPLFLVLAGIAMELRAASALRRGASPAALRGALSRRGLRLIGYGYLVSIAYALIDGVGGTNALADLLRADILHCIGASLILCAPLLTGRDHLPLRAAALIAASFAVAPLVHPLLAGAHLPPLVAAPLAVLVDVPGYTRFPLFPLCGFVALGNIAGRLLLTRPLGPRGRALGCLVFLAGAALFDRATAAAVAALGGALTRWHPAVVLNFLDGACRALAVVLLGVLLGPSVIRRPRLAAWLLRLGRNSLLAYVFHVPFCYGRLAGPLRGALSMAAATPWVAALAALTSLVVAARERLGPRRVPPSPQGWHTSRP